MWLKLAGISLNSRTQVLSILLAVEGSWPFLLPALQAASFSREVTVWTDLNSIDTSVRWRWCWAYCLKTKIILVIWCFTWWQSIMLLWLCLMPLKIPFNQIITSWWETGVSEAGSWSVNSAERINTLCLFCSVVCFHVLIAERNLFHFWLLQYFNSGKLFREWECEHLYFYLFT